MFLEYAVKRRLMPTTKRSVQTLGKGLKRATEWAYRFTAGKQPISERALNTSKVIPSSRLLNKFTIPILITNVAILSLLVILILRPIVPTPSLSNMTFLGLRVTTAWDSLLLLVVFSASLGLQSVEIWQEQRRFLLMLSVGVPRY